MWPPPTPPLLTTSIAEQCIAFLEKFRVDAIAVVAAVTNITDAPFGLSVTGAFLSVCCETNSPDSFHSTVLKQTNDRFSHKILHEKLIVVSVSQRMRTLTGPAAYVRILFTGRTSAEFQNTKNEDAASHSQTNDANIIVSLQNFLSHNRIDVMLHQPASLVAQLKPLYRAADIRAHSTYTIFGIEAMDERERTHDKGREEEVERKMEKIALHYLCRCSFCVVSKRHSHPGKVCHH